MRLFVALNLPGRVERELWAYMEKLRRSYPKAGRFSRRENLHLTLAFIGEADEGAAGRIASELLTLPNYALTIDLAGSASRLTRSPSVRTLRSRETGENQNLSCFLNCRE